MIEGLDSTVEELGDIETNVVIELVVVGRELVDKVIKELTTGDV